MKYTLKDDVWFTSGDALLGPLEGSWKAGTYKPKSEAEEEMFRRLMAGGFAEAVPETKTEKAAAEEA